jgi:type IV conjugative transfer system coupling protein TraD
MKSSHSFKGFETLFNNARMGLKMYLYTFIFLVIIYVSLFMIMSALYFKKNEQSFSFFKSYSFAKVISFIKPSHVMKLTLHGKPYHISAIEYVQSYKPYYHNIIQTFLSYFTITLAVYVIYPFILIFFKKRAHSQTSQDFIRGSQLIKSKDIKRRISHDGHECFLTLGDIPLPVKDEVRHAFIVGKPGSGKTVLLNSILTDLIRRDNRGIVYDYKGDYVSTFYNPAEDILFNPLDKRCLGWSVMNEITTAMDIDSIAHSLIPQAYQADPFWNDAARDVFSGILHYLYHKGRKKNTDIWESVTAPGKEIAHMLSQVKGGERGLRYIEDASSKQAMSVFSVLMQYVKSFEFMSHSDGEFSLDRWLDRDKGWIYVTNYSLVQDTLRPILSLFIDLLGKKLLSRKDDYNRRIFFFLDEFGTLQRLSTIVRLLTLSRSKGGSVWIGIQDIGQIDKLYTQPLRQAIINACGINVIFSVADPKTAHFLSDKIGDISYNETQETYSMGVKNYKDGVSISQRVKQESLVLPSEIMNLKDLSCYIKIPNYDISQTHLSYRNYSDNELPLIIRDDLRDFPINKLPSKWINDNIPFGQCL